jgi:RNA polymerase sigma-70 factor (ECF subfamily)
MLSAMSNDHMMDRLNNLDPRIIGEIYDQFFIEIFRYVRYRISDDVVAEDITSDVFVRLLEASQNENRPQANLKGWLISTASNAVNDHFRRQYRRPTESLSDSMVDETANIHTEVDLREQYQAVQMAYTQLTSEQQDVLALRFGQGYSLEETAIYLNKKANAVKALQFRALASLQRLIDGDAL